jgi:hypothetical protein
VADNYTFAFYAVVGRGLTRGATTGEFNLANLPATDVTGEIAYFLPPQTSGLNRAGFNTVLVANGSSFSALTAILPGGSVTLTATGGNLAAPIILNTSASAGVPVLSSIFSTWARTASIGTFRVKVVTTPGTRAKFASGIYLPKSHSACGYFPGTTVGGSITLTQQ